MTIKFKYGVEYGGFIFGWNKGEFYRLPSTSGNKSYGFKKLDLIPVGNHTGYRVKRQKFSIQQLKDRTIIINKEVKIINDSDIPL